MGRRRRLIKEGNHFTVPLFRRKSHGREARRASCARSAQANADERARRAFTGSAEERSDEVGHGNASRRRAHPRSEATRMQVGGARACPERRPEQSDGEQYRPNKNKPRRAAGGNTGSGKQVRAGSAQRVAAQHPSACRRSQLAGGAGKATLCDKWCKIAGK